jgi:hypothetical protein
MPTISNTPNLGVLLALLNLLSGQGGAGLGGTQGAAGGTTSPQLEAFLQAIPFANDGDVITPDHHNTLRAALGQIARSLDETQFARVVTESFTPALLPAVESGLGTWRTRAGGSVGPDSGEDHAAGWMPLDLPGGTNVDTLAVRGATPANVGFWSVSLRRVDLAGGDSVDVCFKEIQTEANANHAGFVVPVPVDVDGLAPAAAAERRRVDNEKYQYLFYTEFNSAGQADGVEIRAVQVTCTRG